MNKIDEIKNKIQKLKQELKDIQESCCHPGLTRNYTYGANTGNWDKSDDCYWTDFVCTLCDKHWRVDGSVKVPSGATRIDG